MITKKFQKCVKFGFSILVSTILLGTTSILSCFATTKEAIAPSQRFGNLSVIVESSDNTIPEDSTLKAEFVVDDDLEFQASEYDYLCNRLDQNLKKNIERLGIFNLKLFDKNGKEINNLDKNASVFIEIPKDFDKQDVQVYYISEGDDEHFEEKVVTRNGKNYINFETKHFSPYALIDEETRGTFFSILGASIIGAIIIAAIVVYIIYKRKQNVGNA